MYKYNIIHRLLGGEEKKYKNYMEKKDKVSESINVQAAFIMQFFSFVKVKSWLDFEMQWKALQRSKKIYWIADSDVKI